MGTGFIICGIIFLLNPNINIVDILPDIIGYALIYHGLFRFSDIDDRFTYAREKAKWLMIVSAAKLVFVFMLPSSSDSDVLLFTFCFAVVELLLCIPMFTEFFGGMNYICSRYDNETALKYESEAKFFVIGFVVIKNVITLIPELFSLSDTSYGLELDYDHYKNLANVEAAKKICIIGAFALVLVCGIVMGVKFISYLKKFTSDREFIGRLKSYYEENIMSDTTLWARRYQNTALTFFAVGVMLFNNFYLDTFPVIPDFIGYIFLAAGSTYLAKLGFSAFGVYVCSVLGIGVNIVSIIYRLYNSNYGVFSHYYLEYYKQPFSLSLDIAGAVIFTITLYMILTAVKKSTADNPYEKKFPSVALKVIVPFAAIGTLCTDALPALSDFTEIDGIFPDYYAFGAFVIPLTVLIITTVCAVNFYGMKTNSSR
ncbi:MAG: hypothetical protein IJO52_06565 [Clostridia bacterium]|nr:hypothetical protein [Clostridia bacterium]